MGVEGFGGKSCANCGVLNCKHLDKEWPEFCLTSRTPSAVFSDTLESYAENPKEAAMFQAAAEIEGLYYGRLTRVEEVVLFAQKIGAKKVGIATCMGLIREAQLFAKVLKAKGIEDCCAVACKVGGIDKTKAGIPDSVKVHPGEHESICNPLAQARILNEAKTDLNVIIGLCVGHDTLFIQHSEAPITYLVVKDRVLGHNPAAALYTSGSYYKRLLSPDLPDPRSDGYA